MKVEHKDQTTQHLVQRKSIQQIFTNSYLFINSVEIHRFKAKYSEFNADPICLGNVAKYFLVDNMEKTRLIFDFSI